MLIIRSTQHHPTKVVLRKESATVSPLNVDPLDKRYPDNATNEVTDPASGEPSFYTAQSNMFGDSLWSQTRRPLRSPPLSLNNNDNYANTDLLASNFDNSLLINGTPTDPITLRGMHNGNYHNYLSYKQTNNQSLWDGISSINSHDITKNNSSMEPMLMSTLSNGLDSRYFHQGEESGLASRYFMHNEGEGEGEAIESNADGKTSNGESMLASRYLKAMSNSTATASIAPHDGHPSESSDAFSNNSWPIRPLHEVDTPDGSDSNGQGLDQRLEQSRQYAHTLRTKLTEQSTRVNQLDEKKRQIIDLVSDILSNSSLRNRTRSTTWRYDIRSIKSDASITSIERVLRQAERQYIDNELPIKERRLAKIQRLRSQEAKVGQLMKALSTPRTGTIPTSTEESSHPTTSKPAAITNNQQQQQHRMQNTENVDAMDWMPEQRMQYPTNVHAYSSMARTPRFIVPPTATSSPASQLTHNSTTPPQSPPLSMITAAGVGGVGDINVSDKLSALPIAATAFRRSAMKGQRDTVPGLARSVTWNKNVEQVLYYNPST
ncbi:hypothetical protein BDF22DRAFT_662322 [Syncephalis plumigaleata]|nr:hypothetical protein BDF22DRAFT_662322 [Syncephalis plumigaleata]